MSTVGRAREHLAGARFREINERLYNMGVAEGARFLEENPDAFAAYHAGFRRQVRAWPIVPAHHLARMLEAEAGQLARNTGTTTLVIGDFGCGDAYIARTLDGHTIQEEGQAIQLVVECVDACPPEDVAPHLRPLSISGQREPVPRATKPVRFTQCSLANIALPSASLDVCILCLALMGTDCLVPTRPISTPITEAARCLKEGGTLYVCEVGSRVTNKTAFAQLLCCAGFTLDALHDHNYFILCILRKDATAARAPPPSLVARGSLKGCTYKRR